MNGTDVLSVVLGHGTTQPEAPAVKDLDRELTYGQLVGEVGCVAAGLVACGIGEGDRVALHLPNSVDFVVAALGTLRAGAMFVPLAVTDPEARRASVVEDCGAGIVVTGDSEDGKAAIGTLGGVRAVRYSELPATTDPVPRPLAVRSDRLAYAIYTSGTTGTPKGVSIDCGAFVAAVGSTAAALDLTSRTRTLCVSPFYFDGSFGTLFPTLFAGGAVVIRPREALLFPRTFFKAVHAEGITYTGFSPSYLKLLLASPQLASLNESTLDLLALGGEASSVSDVRALWEAAPALRVFNRYGPTETTIAVTHIELTPELVADDTIPIGCPHPGVTFHIVDERGSLVDGEDRVGELYIGGSQLMAGYWGAPDLTTEVMRHDVVAGQTVYRTGDLVYRNQHGHYVYVDRADRVVKRSGVRISLLELAEAMRALPGVSAAACSLFDNDGTLGIVSFVATDGSVTAVDLRSGARSQLPDTMLPDRIELVAELPLTASSKVDERGLLADAGLVGMKAAATNGGVPLVS